MILWSKILAGVSHLLQSLVGDQQGQIRYTKVCVAVDVVLANRNCIALELLLIGR